MELHSLKAHLAVCSPCATFALGVRCFTAMLRDAELEAPTRAMVDASALSGVSSHAHPTRPRRRVLRAPRMRTRLRPAVLVAFAAAATVVSSFVVGRVTITPQPAAIGPPVFVVDAATTDDSQQVVRLARDSSNALTVREAEVGPDNRLCTDVEGQLVMPPAISRYC